MLKTIILWWGLIIKDIVYNQICKLIDKNNLDGEIFLLAVSGGIDSIVLVDIMLEIQKKNLNRYKVISHKLQPSFWIK